MSITMDTYQKTVLERLYKNRCFGKHHLTEETILHWFKTDQWGEAKEALHKLVKKKYVVKKPHHPDNMYYLNRERLQEIIDIVTSP